MLDLKKELYVLLNHTAITSCVCHTQAAVFTRGGPLYLVGDVAFMLGDCTVPALMLVLGANLGNGERTFFALMLVLPC